MRLPVVHTPPVDAVASYPVVVDESSPPTLAPPPFLQSGPASLVVEEEPLFDDVTSENAVYKLPAPGVLQTSPEQTDASGETAARVAELLVQTLAHFGIQATV